MWPRDYFVLDFQPTKHRSHFWFESKNRRHHWNVWIIYPDVFEAVIIYNIFHAINVCTKLRGMMSHYHQSCGYGNTFTLHNLHKIMSAAAPDWPLYNAQPSRKLLKNHCSRAQLLHSVPHLRCWICLAYVGVPASVDNASLPVSRDLFAFEG